MINTDRIIKELEIIALATVEDFIMPGVIPRLRENIAKEKMCALKEITCYKGKIDVKLHDKVAALNKLGDYYGLWSDFNLAIATLQKYGLELTRDENGNWQVQDISKQLANIEA